MRTCLLGLGSNLGEREATLRAAIAEISALPDVQLVRHSTWHRSQPVGGPPGQFDYINGAVVVETRIAPLTLLSELQQIEHRHGRVRTEHWTPRTLDIDLLLYGNDVIETEMLTLPHPRMSFRRFVLEPAAEIAPRMLHPVIGWKIERLLLHLQMASDTLAVLSPSELLRIQLAKLLSEHRDARPTDPPKFEGAEHHWPSSWTSWLEIPSRPRQTETSVERGTRLKYSDSVFPKLSVLLDGDIAHRGADKLKWSTLVGQPGRGPTLRLQTTNHQEVESEVLAAVDAVWA